MNTRLVVALGLCLVFKLSAIAATGPQDPAVQELIALEERWVHAENMRDADTLRTILDERMIVVLDSGVRSWDEFIAGVMKSPVDPTQTQELTDRTFHIDGDTAVTSEIDTLRGTPKAGRSQSCACCPASRTR